MEEQINITALLEWYIENGVDASCGETSDLLQPAKTQALQPMTVVREISRPTIASAVRQAVSSSAETASEACLNARKICEKATTLEELKSQMEVFEGCTLKFTAKSTVFGSGPVRAPIMIIGEAPGADEDRIGLPFVGRCGQLLEKMLASIGLKREEVFITNILPWRPPGNRTPTDAEVAVCLPFLKRQIDLADPKYLLLLGGSAAGAVLDTTDPISKIRGHWVDYQPIGKRKIEALPSYHPSFLLRNPAQKAKSWSDLLRMAKKLKEN